MELTHHKPMNRKSFIQSSAILLGSTFFSSNIALGIGHKPEKLLKKALGFDMIKEDLTIMDKFQLVKDLGFQGIEINSPSNLNLNELTKAIDKTGVIIPSTVNKDHWSIPLSSSDASVRQKIVKSIGESIETTKILGGDTVLVVPGVVNKDMPYEMAYNNALMAVRDIIPMAEKANIKIGFENVWNNFILSPVEAKHFLDEINHPLIGWYFDIGNVLRYGWPEHWIETLNSKIFKLHAKEFSIKKMNDEGLWKGFSVELGQGDVNWSAVMTKIKQIDYKGEWITLELGGGDRQHLLKLSNQFDSILKSV